MLCFLLGIEAEFVSSNILTLIMERLPATGLEYKENISSVFSNDLVTVLRVVLVGPVVEELFFRGLVLWLSGLVIPFFAANIVQALLFGVYHMNLVQGIYAFLLGLLMGYIKKCTGSLIPCILFHIAFNMTGLLIDDFMPPTSDAVRVVMMILFLAACVFTLRKLVCDRQTS